MQSSGRYRLRPHIVPLNCQCTAQCFIVAVAPKILFQPKPDGTRLSHYPVHSFACCFKAQSRAINLKRTRKKSLLSPVRALIRIQCSCHAIESRIQHSPPPWESAGISVRVITSSLTLLNSCSPTRFVDGSTPIMLCLLGVGTGLSLSCCGLGARYWVGGKIGLPEADEAVDLEA
jgi:hypothetical protein